MAARLVCLKCGSPINPHDAYYDGKCSDCRMGRKEAVPSWYQGLKWYDVTNMLGL